MGGQADRQVSLHGDLQRLVPSPGLQVAAEPHRPSLSSPRVPAPCWRPSLHIAASPKSGRGQEAGVHAASGGEGEPSCSTRRGEVRVGLPLTGGVAPGLVLPLAASVGSTVSPAGSPRQPLGASWGAPVTEPLLSSQCGPQPSGWPSPNCYPRQPPGRVLSSPRSIGT